MLTLNVSLANLSRRDAPSKQNPLFFLKFLPWHASTMDHMARSASTSTWKSSNASFNSTAVSFLSSRRIAVPVFPALHGTTAAYLAIAHDLAPSSLHPHCSATNDLDVLQTCGCDLPSPVHPCGRVEFILLTWARAHTMLWLLKGKQQNPNRSAVQCTDRDWGGIPLLSLILLSDP